MTPPAHASTHAAWYLLQSKPRQEQRAAQHLRNQGYTCYLPMLSVERLQRGKRVASEEPLFPGYLFIQLDSVEDNWAPIRSTRGVNRLVAFGGQPLPVSDALVEQLRQRAQHARPLLEQGDRVKLQGAGFEEVDAIFLSMDGSERVILLLNMLNRQQQVRVPLSSIRKS